MSLFAEASKRAAVARFKQRVVDAEGQEREVSALWAEHKALFSCGRGHTG